jgi:M6 family metalloprotease-like protein
VAAVGASADMTTETDRLPGSPLATVDGIEIRHAVLIGEHRLQEPRHGSDGILHETGHVLGLPDLYADVNAVGGWDPMSFNVTPKWSAQWGTTFDFQAHQFADHSVTLQRQLHDWRTIFAFTRGPNGNFAFNFFIALNAAPDIKFDYNKATYRPPGQ